MAQEARSALAVVFLVDRFLYWTDESGRLLKITKLLHRRYPEAPVAPQLVIRQARVYLNSGTVCWKGGAERMRLVLILHYYAELSLALNKCVSPLDE